MNYQELLNQAVKDKIKRFVVGAVIIQNNKALLLKRPADDFFPNIFELPSGKVEENENFEQAIRREIKEETGLDIENIIKYLNYFDYNSKSGKKTREFNFLVKIRLGKVKLSEHTEYKWISKAELKDNNITDNVINTLNLVLE